VNIITQEDFEKMTPRAPRKLNPEVPPPPPPSLAQSMSAEEPIPEIARRPAPLAVSDSSWLGFSLNYAFSLVRFLQHI
jgi:hypothetical protein